MEITRRGFLLKGNHPELEEKWQLDNIHAERCKKCLSKHQSSYYLMDKNCDCMTVETQGLQVNTCK